MTEQPHLPVPIGESPRWRVLYRPVPYERERVSSIRRLWELVERNRVRLRGWDFPHVSPRQEEREHGSTWIASWSSFMSHLEYWRFYQSTQFLYLASVREWTEKQWAEKLRRISMGHFRGLDPAQFDRIRGFFSIQNFIYTITEFFEFAARLCRAGVYEGTLSISVGLYDIRDFALTTEPERVWWNVYKAQQDWLGNTWQVNTVDLVPQSSQYSMDAIVWFFERFGWIDIEPGVLRSDQERFLAKKL